MSKDKLNPENSDDFHFPDNKLYDNEYIIIKSDIIPEKNKSNDMDWSNLKPINTSTIKSVDFPSSKYYSEKYTKNQIVLHHTVSNPNSIEGDINHWLSMTDRIATCMVVGGKGDANQCFSSSFWAHHLGVKSTFLKSMNFSDYAKRNTTLNRESIAIEIDNWGGLILGNGLPVKFGEKTITTISGKYYTAYGNTVDTEVQEYPDGYKGYKFYQKYTTEQIRTVGELLLFWNVKFGIPLNYNEDMWNVSRDALSGEPGVWTHTSYRMDKSDCHPQPEFIEMLKSLKDL